MTTYDPAIPQSTNLISNSQQDILDNFGQLNTQFAIDHIAFNTGSGNGNGHHKQITFDNAVAAPTITGTMSAIYPLLTNSAQQLFFKNATAAIQLTGPVTAAAAGTTTLPGGIILKWGSDTTTSNPQSPAFAYSTGPMTNNTFAVFLQIITNTANTLRVSAKTAAGFTTTGVSGINFYYLAIGN